MEAFVARRAEWIAAASPGPESARELARLTDEAVRDLARAASSPSGRWAIVALGGWGSGALLPQSDLDLLVLSDAPAARLKPFVEEVLYPLWDAGLKVGHQVRSPRDQMRAVREDLKTRTAALTGRPLAGDLAWAAEVFAAGASDAHRRARGVLAALAKRGRPGSPYLLDTDLKEGAGGRRDYDELTWSAAVVTGAVAHSPEGLVDAGVLSTSEWDALARAADTLSAARWVLQRDGYKDRLSAEAAAAIGPLGQHVQDALGLTALVLARVRDRLGKRPSLSEDDWSAAEVLALLGAGDSALSELELGAQAGRLDALVPGFSAAMTLRRPGLGHELTVGAHSLKAAALLAGLGRSASGVGHTPLARSRASVTDLRAVQVAALAHDLGKAEHGSQHAERGAPGAAESARRFGLDPRAAADAADLVRLHLVLVETALHDDLDDEDAVLRCASRIARRDLVAPLHLLTVADSIATGPSTFTPWTDALLAKLVSRLDAALSDDVDGAGLAERGEAVRAATLSALASAADAERAFVAHASLRYLAALEPAQVARDARLVADLARSPAAEPSRVAVRPGPGDGLHEVTVIARDRPALLSRIAGAMSLAGLDILGVEAFSAGGGVALDRFVVTSATRQPLTTESFTHLERLIDLALVDRLELAVRLAERRRHYRQRSRRAVTVEITRVGLDTAVKVTAPDRPGLLHDLAREVSGAGLGIRWAKATTVDGVAVDTFHVVGEDGGPADDTGVLGHLSMNLRALR